MKRVYCRKCEANGRRDVETFNDVAEHPRDKDKSNKCVHPENEQELQKKINYQLQTRSLLVKSRPMGEEKITWVITYSRVSGQNTSALHPERHPLLCTWN
jgi:hypothetical protein